MIYTRQLEKIFKRVAKFPVIGVFGPRQSGKTTLVKSAFTNHTYLNFEDPATRSYALNDPWGFFKQYENPHGIILDEFQHVPQILSYIQIEADAKDRPGYFVLTGSQNFLMNQAITQSLAGRIAILTLLPMSFEELHQNDIVPSDVDDLLFTGGYPRVYAKGIEPTDLYPSYIHSYVERDIRQLVNVENLNTFQKFMQLCAGRIGQILNISDLAVSCNISQRTVTSWLSILEASYIIFLLQPYYVNFNKRVTKSPKIFFFDTGLACSLLNIRSSNELGISQFKGHIFECAIIADLFKQFYNAGERPSLYFWRDLNGRVEVDCLIDFGGKLTPVEVKSGQTPNGSYFDSLTKWNEIANAEAENGYVIYGGLEKQKRSAGNLMGWKEAGHLIATLKDFTKS
jgi:predicted AAA+ superfamily ATPase